MRGIRLILAAAAVEVAALQPASGFAALVPQFIEEWGLSNAEAGWILGINFLGYMAVVPFLMDLTDRVDARRVLIGGCVVSAAANFGYAVAADGFWSALFWRGLSGAGMAGCYMPGLKALTDRMEPGDQSRGVTFYTASYSVGVSLSFVLTGAVTDAAGWHWAFAVGGLGPLLGVGIALRALDRRPPPVHAAPRRLLDFRPVLRNREALGYVLAYGAHGFELFALRSWTTAFLAYVLSRSPGGDAALGITAAAAVSTLIGLPASLLGNELALRFGRQRVVVGIMLTSALCAPLVGLAAALPYTAVVAAIMLYSVLVTADSGSITSGAIAAVPAEQRGALMAVHSTFGFAASFLGPLAVGIALDLVGGGSLIGWGVAFAVMGAGVALGPLAFWLLSPVSAPEQAGGNPAVERDRARPPADDISQQ